MGDCWLANAFDRQENTAWVRGQVAGLVNQSLRGKCSIEDYRDAIGMERSCARKQLFIHTIAGFLMIDIAAGDGGTAPGFKNILPDYVCPQKFRTQSIG